MYHAEKGGVEKGGVRKELVIKYSQEEEQVLGTVLCSQWAKRRNMKELFWILREHQKDRPREGKK